MKKKKQERNSGQTLVEFALCLTLFLLLTLGIIQFGVVYNAANTLTNLSREGARYAAIHGTETTTMYEGTSTATDIAIRKYIRQAATSTSIRPSDLPDSAIVVTPVAGNAARIKGSAITIRLTYDMRKKLFLPVRFLRVTFPTSYVVTTTMIIE